MTALEIAGIVGSLLGSGSALGVWLRTRGTTAQAREESATAVVPELRGVIAEMRAEVRELRAALDEAEERHIRYERQISGLSERVAVLERDLGDRDAHIRRLEEALAKRDADITQRIEVAAERVARRTPTPPEGMPAQPEPALMVRTGPRTLADVPPPKRGKETR